MFCEANACIPEGLLKEQFKNLPDIKKDAYQIIAERDIIDILWYNLTHYVIIVLLE